MKIYCSCMVFLLLVLPVQVAAETISVRQLILIGLEKNIGLQAEQLDVPIAAQAVEVEDAAFDPELFASTAYAESSTPIASSLSLASSSESDVFNATVGVKKKYHSGLLASLSFDTEWVDDNSYSDDLSPRYRSGLNLTLTQPLLRDFGRQVNDSSLTVARNRQLQSALDLQLRAQTLALEIEVLAAQLAGETAILELRSDAVALAEKLFNANRRRFETGIIPVSEVQEAETALASRQLDRSISIQARAQLFEELSRKLNHRLTTAQDFASLYPFFSALELPDLPGEARMFSAARENSVSLQIIATDARTAAVQQSFYRNQLKPRLDMKLQAGLSGLSGEQRNTAVNNRYAGDWPDSFSAAAGADGYHWGAGLEFSLPLGNRQARSRLRQAELQRKQVDFRQRDLEEELRSELIRQRVDLQKSFEQLAIANRFESLAELTLHQEQRRLEEGLSDTFRIINFQDNMIRAKVGRVSAVVQYFVSLARLNFTRGIILEKNNINLTQLARESSFEIL